MTICKNNTDDSQTYGATKSPGVVVKTDSCVLTPRILEFDLLGLEWTGEFAVVTTVQMMLTLLVWGPVLENHCSKC